MRMMQRLPLLLLALLALALADTTTTTATNKRGPSATESSTPSNNSQNDEKGSSPSTSTINPGLALVTWLQSHEQGFFSDKLKLNIDANSNTANGVFAVERIAANETILVIPTDCLLKPPPEKQDDMCETTKKLAREYLLGDQAEFAAYAQYTLGYLNDPNYPETNADRFKLPRAWSQPAKDVMHTILGPDVLAEPHDSTEGSTFLDICDMRHVRDFTRENTDLLSSNNNHYGAKFLLDEAWLQIVARSWNEVMIPLLDMFNHRNGHWHNVDQVSSAHDPNSESVVVVATRDVQPGEQLYLSYNDCRDSDCHGIGQVYVLPSILQDYGFVEQYPRRWRFDLGDGVDERPDDEEGVFIFEVDYDTTPTAEDPEPPLKLHWLSHFHPDAEEMFQFRGILNRLYLLQTQIEEQVAELPSKSERAVVMDYYQALMEALEYLIQSTDTHPERGSNNNADYDDLVERKKTEAEAEEEKFSICYTATESYLGTAPYDEVDSMTSNYQDISFEHNAEIDDTCLYLSGWLQTCTSWRPHYHETVVHYPLSFVEEPKRVIYLGGGDNMLLHEILKYPSIELVIGMELDQQVVRSSFKNMATQPHFDNDKVQWWFGDCSKTLAMLLEQGDKIYHTFDLVIVDLLTNVVETLMVTKDMTIMDVAVELLQPNGVIARNEDFYPRRSTGFVKHEVDLEVLDLPMLCQQSITIGSPNVDFLSKAPKDHNIDTVYLGKSDLDKTSNNEKYTRWLNYRNNDMACNKTKSNIEHLDMKAAEGALGAHGVHMILEIEDTIATYLNPEVVNKRISEALTKAGLTELSITSAPADQLMTIYLYAEGYVMIQVMKEQEYIAVDMKLWSDYEKLDAAKANLVAAIGSDDDKSSSSYRIVTGGMFGAVSAKAACSIPMESIATCEELGEAALTNTEATVADTTTSKMVLQQAIAMLANPKPSVAVFCADAKSSCAAFEALSNAESVARNVIPVRACPSIANDHEKNDCQTAVLASLIPSVKARGKFDVVVFDGKAPKEMGQILHKILAGKPRRAQLLQKDYVVLTTSSDSASLSWQRALLERFQTQFDPFSPAQRSHVVLRGEKGGFDLGIFSSGDYNFFPHLEALVFNLEEESGLSVQIRNVDDGALNYIPGFRPSIIGRNDDYDKTDALEQWVNQTPVAEQTIYQYEIQPKFVPIEIGEKVLINNKQDIWKGQWTIGKVIAEKDGKYTIVRDADGAEAKVDRNVIRIYETLSPLDVSDQVLIRRNEFVWTQGAVIAKNKDETFEVRKYDTDGEVTTVHRKDLVLRSEAVDFHGAPSISCTKIKNGFIEAIKSVSDYMEGAANTKDHVHVFHGFGEGCFIASLAPEVRAVATWDGRSHIDLSLFVPWEGQELQTSFSEAFLKELDFLNPVARDIFPRGYGRVVNFRREFDQDFHWTDRLEDMDEMDEEEQTEDY